MVGQRSALDVRPDVRERLRLGYPEWLAVAAFAVVMAVVYIWSGPSQSRTDGWFLLADSFLHGQLSIDSSRPWIEVAAAGPGRWYLPFPPVPAVVLMPIVALLGVDGVDTSGVAGLVGGLNVALMWVLLRRLGLSQRATAWLAVSFAIGSEALYAAATGGVHLWTETLGLSFALGALVLAVRRQWPLAGGALLVLAAGCRPPYLLAAFAYLALYAGPVLPRPGPAAIRRIVFFCAAAAPIGLLILAYNVARFGSPFEFGYDRIVSATTGESVLSEPWYAYGIVSPAYLARGLFTMLLRGFEFTEQPPWIQPSWAGTSILLTMPVLVYLVKAFEVRPLVAIGWLGLVPPLLLDLMHGNPGYAQFGYRFFLDGLPFAWLLLALVVRETGLTPGMRRAIAVGVVVNVYGLSCASLHWMAT